MSQEKLKIIKEADITNNCPECFNQELKLTFYQKYIYTKFYHKTTADVTHELQCKTCNSLIFPAKWTEDIERTFNYYQKMAIPKKTTTRYTSLFYILFFIVVALIAVGIFAYLEGLIQF